MKNCPGCLKPNHDTYCAPCRKRLFDGKKVSHVLSFSRPDYNQAKLASSPAQMSISGIQTKISVALRKNQLEMVEAGGHYILKPIPYGVFQHLEMVPINEHLTMQIARQAFGIFVAENGLVEFADGELAYLVRRFDVQPNGQRSLQEDFAQIANRSEESHGKNYKYDFSYEEIGELIQQHVSAHRVELEKLFQIVVFNYLIRNGDAHLKNFSLIRNDEFGTYALTPAYDLLNTGLHIPFETRTALPFFKDEFETESYQVNTYYALDDFQELAHRLDLHPDRATRILRAAVDKQQDVFSLIDRSALSADCKAEYKRGIQDSVKALSYSYRESQSKKT